MKILQVIAFFTPARGGSVIVPYNLSKELSKRGHEVTIITTDFEFDEEYAKSIEKEVEAISFHCIANIKLFLISPSMKRWLKTNIKNFDVIHMHTFRSYQNSIVYHYAKKYDIPYVLQAHGSLPRTMEKQRLKKLYDWIWGNRILKDTSKVIAVTKTEAEQYKKMGVNEDKIEIVLNGIDLSEYEALPRRGEFRKKYAVRDDEKIVLYLGRIHKTKGIDLLVKAFSELTEKLNDIKLVIVGPDDGFLPTLKRQIKDLKIGDRVLFTGPLYGRDKLKAYVDADIFVTPSFYGFPVVFLEACACGIPIITTNNGDKLDWIHEKVGYVVEYDKDQLKDAIFKILSGEELRRRFGEEGRGLVKKEFNWDKVVRKVEVIYEDCIERQKDEKTKYWHTNFSNK